MYEKNWQELANEIILMAVKDFRAAYKRLKRFPNSASAQDAVRDLTQFFCSDWFHVLADLDGPALLNRIMRQIDEKSKGGGAR